MLARTAKAAVRILGPFNWSLGLGALSAMTEPEELVLDKARVASVGLVVAALAAGYGIWSRARQKAEAVAAAERRAEWEAAAPERERRRLEAEERDRQRHEEFFGRV